MAVGLGVILDTCAVLFLASGDRRLSAATRKRMAVEPVRWLCTISGFEIAMKYRQGKLALPMHPMEWLRAVEERYSLSPLPLDTELCVSAAELPDHHRDPCDRFIIAAALRLRVAVVTVDDKFLPYGVDILS